MSGAFDPNVLPDAMPSPSHDRLRGMARSRYAGPALEFPGAPVRSGDHDSTSAVSSPGQDVPTGRDNSTPGLNETLDAILAGRVRFVGVGNPEQGDDGLGVRLAELLAERGREVVMAGLQPEQFLGEITAAGADAVVFLDAVRAGAEPGSIIILEAAEIETRYPQVSTHRISLGTLARFITSRSGARVHLIGVEPESLAASNSLSPRVAATVEALAEIVAARQSGNAA